MHGTLIVSDLDWGSDLQVAQIAVECWGAVIEDEVGGGRLCSRWFSIAYHMGIEREDSCE